jgi:ribosomal protein L20A (L18A)
MKSSNDIYHGDEHITDKPQKYLVEASETVYYEVEIEAMSKEEAFEKAYEIELGTEEHVVNYQNFQVDNIAEVKDKQNYNYSYGGTE